jgi:hypothetical protein
MRAIELLTAIGTGKIILSQKHRKRGVTSSSMESGSDAASDAVYSTDSQGQDMHISEYFEIPEPDQPRFKITLKREAMRSKVKPITISKVNVSEIPTEHANSPKPARSRGLSPKSPNLSVHPRSIKNKVVDFESLSSASSIRAKSVHELQDLGVALDSARAIDKEKAATTMSSWIEGRRKLD